MQRREATLVFREICECIPDAFLLNGVSLKQIKIAADRKYESYELQIKAFLDRSTLEQIRSVVRKHNLIMNEKRDYVSIYTHEMSPMEIVA